MQKRARRKERHLRAILTAAEAEREYLRSLYNGSLISMSHTAQRAREGVAARDHDALAAEARCVGMEDEIRRLRAENEALRAHVSAIAAASLTPRGFQLHPGPTGYRDAAAGLVVPRGGGDAGRLAYGDSGSAGAQLTGEEEAGPFSCSTSPIPRDPDPAWLDPPVPPATPLPPSGLEQRRAPQRHDEPGQMRPSESGKPAPQRPTRSLRRRRRRPP